MHNPYNPNPYYTQPTITPNPQSAYYPPIPQPQYVAPPMPQPQYIASPISHPQYVTAPIGRPQYPPQQPLYSTYNPYPTYSPLITSNPNPLITSNPNSSIPPNPPNTYIPNYEYSNPLKRKAATTPTYSDNEHEPPPKKLKLSLKSLFEPPTPPSSDDDDDESDIDIDIADNDEKERGRKGVKGTSLDDRIMDTSLMSSVQKKAYDQRKSNPNGFYYRFNLEGEKQKNGSWSDTEHKTFMLRVLQIGVNVDWGFFSTAVPGRVGYQCSNYWRKLMENGWVEDENYIIENKGGKQKRRCLKKQEILDAAGKNNDDEYYQQFKRFQFTVITDPSGTFKNTPCQHPKASNTGSIKKGRGKRKKRKKRKKKDKKNDDILAETTDNRDNRKNIKKKKKENKEMMEVEEKKECETLKKALKILTNVFKIPSEFLDIDNNHCYCTSCHVRRGDVDCYFRGKPPKKYVLPIGWSRIGLTVDKGKCKMNNVWNDWHIAYHGCSMETAKAIFQSGLQLLKPGDLTIDGYQLPINPGNIQRGFKRYNQYTQQNEIFDPNQIFVSPSIKYAEQYATPFDIICDNEMDIGYLRRGKCAFQLRIRPKSYKIGQETLGATEKGEIIDPNFNNNELEFYTKENVGIVVHGILVKLS